VGHIQPKAQGPVVLKAQILLDRANFSVGEIDAFAGGNFQRAVSGFQAVRKLPVTGTVDDATWTALIADAEPVLMSCGITPEDVAGPFEKIPDDMMEKSKLKALGFESALEAVAEKFHISPKLLDRLNPRKDLKAGEEILVPNVLASSAAGKAALLEISKSELTVVALDASGNVMAQYPATIGSEHDPLPIGKWKIRGVARHPPFHYNPKLFWDAEPTHSKATLAPGPNNPIGVVWIDLSKDHCGIHGTSEPGEVGHTESHGCIRLTNWDAMELAGMVSPGIPAILKE
jgi:lipoprotein-anchoring transpeptidase ErfK/SrfK